MCVPDMSGRVDLPIDLGATTGVVSGVAGAILAWQSESGASNMKPRRQGRGPWELISEQEL